MISQTNMAQRKKLFQETFGTKRTLQGTLLPSSCYVALSPMQAFMSCSITLTSISVEMWFCLDPGRVKFLFCRMLCEVHEDFNLNIALAKKG